MRSFLKRLPGWEPHAGQRAFLESRAKIRVLACGRRWGKTDACAASILSELVKVRPTRHLILAPTLDQAKLLFDRLIAMAESLGGELPDMNVRMSPYPRLRAGGHEVVARSGHLGRALRGNEASHVIVDEAAFVPEELVSEVAMPMLATRNGRLTLISTPHGKNHFWRYFQMGVEGRHGVWSRSGPSSESPHVSKSFLRIQRELISQRAFQIEYEAQFVDAEGTVFPMELIDAAMVPEIHATEEMVTIGIDWARYSDYTSVAVVQGSRQGARLLELYNFNGTSWADMVARAASIVLRHPSAAVVADATGLGDPVAEMLQDQLPRHRVKAFRFDYGSKHRLIDGLRAMFESRALTFEPHPELVRQLTYFQSRVNAKGNVMLNARSGYHDDMVMALGLACQELPCQYRPVVLLGAERRGFRFGIRQPAGVRARFEIEERRD